ncbi:hypothetical protein B0I32_101586 [Nonomuraea fuscirosea]|uniref:SH3 domain-containing protein n=1 Tax=Nonomuraea fuscirosea TaxID=1291556 RepID=A0A2T0NBV9_9ACTN|nr:hypothetical protein B0I32_101586 [Nonomuraea fuscirosea]
MRAAATHVVVGAALALTPITSARTATASATMGSPNTVSPSAHLAARTGMADLAAYAWTGSVTAGVLAEGTVGLHGLARPGWTVGLVGLARPGGTWGLVGLARPAWSEGVTAGETAEAGPEETVGRGGLARPVWMAGLGRLTRSVGTAKLSGLAWPASGGYSHGSPTCRYVSATDKSAPVRKGPGKKYRKRAELAPSKEPVRATCAARGRGRDHWVRLKEGEHEGLWVWRDRLHPWSG